MDAGNMLKPALARGELHVIGATTLVEYRKDVEGDPALERPSILELPEISRRPTRTEAAEVSRGVPSAVHVLDAPSWWARLGQTALFARRLTMGHLALIGRPATELNQLAVITGEARNQLVWALTDADPYSPVTVGPSLTEAQIRDYLMFTADKVGEPIRTVMPRKESKSWFGVAPPDLSLAARARSADWLYTYLRTFYRDARTVTG